MKPRNEYREAVGHRHQDLPLTQESVQALDRAADAPLSTNTQHILQSCNLERFTESILRVPVVEVIHRVLYANRRVHKSPRGHALGRLVEYQWAFADTSIGSF